MTTRCLECGSEQAGDAGECARCGAPAGERPTVPAALLLGQGRVRLRVDENGIKVKDIWVAERVIGWDEVRWLRDGMRLSRRTRWSLEIVLKDGNVVGSEASEGRAPAADLHVLEAIRRAARDHAVPAVFTGRPVRRCGPGIPPRAGQSAAQASAQDVDSPPGKTWVLAGPGDTQLRLDIHEITLRTRRQTSWIAWEDVRWFRDSEYVRPFRWLGEDGWAPGGDGWALAIVLKDGSVVIPDATKKPRRLAQETMTAVRQAAADHAVPAVLTGRPVSATPSPADKPGLYPDPGGEPGLREWTGTAWLPSLLVSPDGDGQAGLVSVVSPLPADVQRREWDAAIDAVPGWGVFAGVMFGMVLGWCLFLPYPLIAIPTISRDGFWLGTSHALAALAWAGIFLWACGLGVVIWLTVRARRILEKVARAATAAAQDAAYAGESDPYAQRDLRALPVRRRDQPGSRCRRRPVHRRRGVRGSACPGWSPADASPGGPRLDPDRDERIPPGAAVRGHGGRRAVPGGPARNGGPRRVHRRTRRGPGPSGRTE